MPSITSSSVTIAPEPPVARTERSTWKPSAGLPIAIDLAMVFGLTGSGNSSPASSARTTGAQPAACAAWIAGSSPSTRPTVAQLFESLEDARQQRAAGDGRDDVTGEAPAELLGDLEAVGLRALGVVGAQVDVREAPLVLVRHLRAQPVHVVVVAADGDDARPVDAGAGDLAGFEIVGDEDVAGEPEPRGVRGDAAGEVAGRRAGEDREPELDRARRGDRDDAILVGTGRMVDRVVLDVQLADAEPRGEPVGAHERREAGVQAGPRLALDRQQLAIAPEVLRAGSRSAARERPLAIAA